jgi:nitroimidazol reductase NimA-like FMN-containing flavoprotein (pyridoxamine 5'-phosphate oxidase superfamily)
VFRELRRKKNEMDIDATKELIKQSRRAVLAVNGDGGYPYAIPINYLYDESGQKIFFHGASKGHKVDALKKSDKVCFTVYGNEKTKDEDWAPFVQSAVVFGRCHLIEDKDLSMKILKKFAMKYYPNEEMVMDEIKASGKSVQIFEISIEHISGKEVQEK